VPAGLVLLAVCRRLPRGPWWWRSVVLGVLNVGGFFVLVYVAAHQLPTSVAASIMAFAPLTLAGLAWLLLGERPAWRLVAGALIGTAGILLVVEAGVGAANPLGVVASLTALAVSSVGAVLTKRWADGTQVLAATCWQLLAGGTLLLVTAGVVEGAPPRLSVAEAAAFGFVALVATALAFACWFAGLAHLQAGIVGIIGLLNPITGALLGTVVAAEPFTVFQALGIGLVLVGIVLGRSGRRPGSLRIQRTHCPGDPRTGPPGHQVHLISPYGCHVLKVSESNG
jgi:probable blue pigment (indigoidine) exporter